MYSSGSKLKIRRKGEEKGFPSVSVTENTQDIVAESETLELVKKDALKETNVVDKDNKQNNGTQSDTNDNSAPAAGNSDNANTASDKSSDKSSEDKTAADKKTSTGSKNTSTDSNNTQQPAGNDSKPAASNQTVAPEPAQSEPAQPEAPKNEYVAPGWIFYGSKAGNGMSGEQKAYIDSLVKQWTDGSISDDALADIFTEKITKEWQIQMISAGVTSHLQMYFPSRE